MSKLSDVIDMRLKELGIKGSKMCDDLGISRSTLTELRKGRAATLKADRAAAIANYLGVTVDYLLGNVGEPFLFKDEKGILHIDDDALVGIKKAPTPEGGRGSLPKNIETINFSKYHQIPILGRISAGLPLYADEHIEGYTITDLNGGAEYFGLRIHGDSMNALRINEGDIIIVRRQEEVEQGEIAVVLVDEEDATVKRFYSSDTTVTLMPQSTNPEHKPQMYDLNKTPVRVLGKVVKVEFTL